MKKLAFGAVSGSLAWAVAASLLIWILRLSWPDYEAAWPTRDFNMAMFVARLSISLLASLVSGAVAARFDRSGGGAPIACGILQLLIAAPYHVMIWDQYPAWYHLFYLFSLTPVAMLGGRLASRLGRRSAA